MFFFGTRKQQKALAWFQTIPVLCLLLSQWARVYCCTSFTGARKPSQGYVLCWWKFDLYSGFYSSGLGFLKGIWIDHQKDQTFTQSIRTAPPTSSNSLILRCEEPRMEYNQPYAPISALPPIQNGDNATDSCHS